MRLFWALIAVLVLAAAGIPVVRSMLKNNPADKVQTELARTREIAAREQQAIESNVKRSLDESEAAAAAAQPEPAPPASVEVEPPQVAKSNVPEATAVPPVAAPEKELPVAAPPAEKTPQTSPPPTAEPKQTEHPADKVEPPKSDPPATPLASTETPAVAPEGSTPAASAIPPAASETAPTAVPETAEAPKIVKKDDGSMLVDDKFEVKGDGTAEKPYEITWELLLSANETYDPRVGRKKLPGRVMMLDGKHVRITGYIAYPLFVEQPRECLMMLNQWDGCCIGVPPTPYDALEVRLKKVVEPELKMATYGIVEGKLGVKPYLAGDWLVGLYIMEQGVLTAKQFNGVGQ